MESDRPQISVVIPVYGSQSSMCELSKRLIESISKITSNFDVILINDSSPDDSWECIKEIVNSDSRFIGIDLSRNFGQHAAITAGLDRCTGEWIVVMDCDLQDQPEEIEKLYYKALEGYDIVLGRRYQRQDKFLKKLSSNLFYSLFSYLTDTKQDGSIGNFGIYNRKVINALNTMRENLRFFPIMVRWLGFKTAIIDIEHANRKEGKSGYSLSKLIKLAFNVIISFSDKPLRLTVQVGIYMSLISFLYALFIMFKAVIGESSIIGWPSLFVSIWFLSGLIIFILGTIGIYVSKIFDQVKKRPIYLVNEILIKDEVS